MFLSCFQILLTFPNLQILYLHGNQINDMKEVEKLAKISTLKKLSLHGNPVENEKVSCCGVVVRNSMILYFALSEYFISSYALLPRRQQTVL